MAMSALYGATANIILNVVLVYMIGIQGATIATVISSFIIYAVRKRAVGNEIMIHNYSEVVITWGLLCLQGAVEIYLSVWWLEIVIIAVIILMNKRTLMDLIITIRSIISKHGTEDKP